jgi:hypothetical protein
MSRLRPLALVLRLEPAVVVIDFFLPVVIGVPIKKNCL